MSAGVCGKRVGFEEIFGSSSSPCSASKRSRCSSLGSPIRSEFGSGSEDRLSILLQMFPALNRELVESVLKTHSSKIEDAIENLHALSIGEVIARNEPQNLDSAMIGNCDALPVGQMLEQKASNMQDNESTFDSGSSLDGSAWIDLFVHEMMNAADLDDARRRAARILVAFESSIMTNSKAAEEHELTFLKEHLQSLLRDNQILKRAVAIQHERNVELEEKANEVQLLKQVVNQYQEQLRTLELSNYTLKLHLQRAQESSSIPRQFHPDVF